MSMKKAVCGNAQRSYSAGAIVLVSVKVYQGVIQHMAAKQIPTKIRSLPRCDRCQGVAARHVVFGLLIADALAIGSGIDSIAYRSEEANLCEEHLGETNVRYVHFAQTTIGKGDYRSAA